MLKIAANYVATESLKLTISNWGASRKHYINVWQSFYFLDGVIIWEHQRFTQTVDMTNLFQFLTGPFSRCVDHDEKVLNFIEIFWTFLACLVNFLQVFSLLRNEILKYHLQMGSKMPPKRLLCNSIWLQFFVCHLYSTP